MNSNVTSIEASGTRLNANRKKTKSNGRGAGEGSDFSIYNGGVPKIFCLLPTSATYMLGASVGTYQHFCPGLQLMCRGASLGARALLALSRWRPGAPRRTCNIAGEGQLLQFYTKSGKEAPSEEPPTQDPEAFKSRPLADAGVVLIGQHGAPQLDPEGRGPECTELTVLGNQIASVTAPDSERYLYSALMFGSFFVFGRMNGRARQWNLTNPAQG